jgi:hypothetical protein
MPNTSSAYSILHGTCPYWAAPPYSGTVPLYGIFAGEVMNYFMQKRALFYENYHTFMRGGHNTIMPEALWYQQYRANKI